MDTARTEARGELTLRMLKTKTGYSGVIVSKTSGRLFLTEGSDPTELWRRLEREAARTSKDYIGFDGARSRFLHFFPAGFATRRYAAEEREYKVKAKARLDASAPLEQAVDGTGFGEAVVAVFRETNLIEQRFEMRRVEDLLRSPSADGFIRAAARFASGDGASALANMAQFAKPYDAAKWTVVTYLPFLWRPEIHMFLKPKVTTDFAARVPFIHAYTPTLDIAVYDSLLNLAAQTEREIEAFHPQDRIDVQSFIWVVGAYTEADAPSPEVAAVEREGISEEILLQLAHDRVWENTGERFEPLQAADFGTSGGGAGKD